MYLKKITKEKLIKFEEDIKRIYETGKIKAPIHLSGNNEDPLIKIFKKIKKKTGFFQHGEITIMLCYMEYLLTG